MNEMQKALDLLEERDPEIQAKLKEAIDERTKDGPIKILVVGGSQDAGMLTEILKRIGATEKVQLVEDHPIRVDHSRLIDTLDNLEKMVRQIRTTEEFGPTPHDTEVIRSEEVEKIKPRKTAVKGFHSNRQFKQQKPAFKNQHQMRAMIRPPRRGG